MTDDTIDGTAGNLASLLYRNASFAATDAKDKVPAIPFIPHRGLFVITCVDPRVDPANILGLELGDAIVLRDVGGRVTPAVLADVAYISYLVETKAPQGPWFEIAVIHHTDCGSGLLADEELRQDFARRSGLEVATLAELPVLDPQLTVAIDVQRLRDHPHLSGKVHVSGHVYDVKTGHISTVA
ncbi:carbonic anhydrase [Actinoallomurus bryophytorum]|uniref:carbonic anhydrase n=1 Tax=Actinoallomurus bryophytorum TaxID=1490222 RepID=A0A543BZD9_9ACTN|nr:carbonic anhydrase [Actinoallomurus bryophytorum]TQL90192.1 carbonic anhydrase [Actinoallomurus bryophytorum]